MRSVHTRQAACGAALDWLRFVQNSGLREARSGRGMYVPDHTICSIVAIPTEYALSLQAEGSKTVDTSLDCSSLSPPF